VNANETTQTASVGRDPAAWQQLADELRPYVELCAAGGFNEDYLPAHVEWYLQRCRIRSRKAFDFLNVPATDGNLGRYNDKDYYLSPESGAVHRGETDTNKVPYYVHVAAVDGRVVELQYYFFYPYNGPVPLFCNPSAGVKTLGAHEGDWEGVRLRVDVDARAIIEVYLATHGDQGIPLRHSTQGAGDPTHYQVIGKRPVVYAAFHSHASYPDIAKHTRLKGLTCDRCTGGRRWDGPAVVVSIDPDLLAPKTTYPEPVWLNWKGRWGSTVQVGNLDLPTSWTSNSPDGPKISDSWTPGRGRGTWGVWTPVAPGGSPPLGEFFTPSATVLGSWPLVGCVESSRLQGPDNRVWVAHRSPDWQFSRVGPVPTGKNVQLVRFAVAADGRVMAFAQDEAGLIYWTAQQPGGSFDRWDDWASLGGSGLRAIQGAFDVNIDDDGFVHVLVPSEDGQLYDIVYESGGSRSGWLPASAAVSLSGAGSGSVATEHSRNGTLVAVYAFAGQSCFLTWSRSGWKHECGVFPQRGPEFLVQSLTRSASGSLYVFALARPGIEWHIQYSHEVAPGQWSPWESIKDAPSVSSVRAIAEANGRIAVLAQVASEVVMTRQNKEGGDWVAWSKIGQPISTLGQPFRNADGRLEAVAIWHDSERGRWGLYNNSESSAYY
jgi:hypothetical protein